MTQPISSEVEPQGSALDKKALDQLFILAARSLGLDCGPMSGFDNAMVDAAFFSADACARDADAKVPKSAGCCDDGGP